LEAAEKTQLLKELVVETRRLSNCKGNRVRDKISSGEREAVRSELVAIAERLVAKYGLTIPDARRVLHELLDVSV
jgi:hypothetical protein